MTDEQFTTVMSRLNSIEIKVEQMDRRIEAIASAVEDCIRHTEWNALSAEWQAEHGAFTDEELSATAAAEVYGVRFVNGLPVPKDSSTSNKR